MFAGVRMPGPMEDLLDLCGAVPFSFVKTRLSSSFGRFRALSHTHKPRKGVRGRRSHRHSADTQAACSTSKERLARGLMTGGSYWTAPEEALWNRICVPVEFTCEIRV